MYLFISIAIMALVTYLIRVLPVTLFHKQLKSRWIASFLYYIPYTVLAALTFPAVFYATGNDITSLAGTVVALVLAFFDRGLLVVAAGAVVGALLTGIFF